MGGMINKNSILIIAVTGALCAAGVFAKDKDEKAEGLTRPLFLKRLVAE